MIRRQSLIALGVALVLGLIAVYLVLVNAVIHIVHGILFRRYNPGLATAIVVFLPLGIMTLVLIQKAGGGQVWGHVAGFLIAVGAHGLTCSE